MSPSDALTAYYTVVAGIYNPRSIKKALKRRYCLLGSAQGYLAISSRRMAALCTAYGQAYPN